MYVYSGFSLAICQYLINSGHYPTGCRACRHSPQLSFACFFVGRWCSCVYFNSKIGVIKSIYLLLSRFRQTSQPNLLFVSSKPMLHVFERSSFAMMMYGYVWIPTYLAVLIDSPPTSSTCTRSCLPAALSTWAASVASLRTVGTVHGFA